MTAVWTVDILLVIKQHLFILWITLWIPALATISGSSSDKVTYKVWIEVRPAKAFSPMLEMRLLFKSLKVEENKIW